MVSPLHKEQRVLQILSVSEEHLVAVSYTHLDVYKRQITDLSSVLIFLFYIKKKTNIFDSLASLFLLGDFLKINVLFDI